jgi:hypothetical protein
MATTNLGFGDNMRSSSDPNRIRFDPNNTAHTDAAKQLAAEMKRLVGAGDEAGARDLYNQKQQQLGFADSDFSPYSGGFSDKNVGDWKNNITANDARQADTFQSNWSGPAATQTATGSQAPTTANGVSGVATTADKVTDVSNPYIGQTVGATGNTSQVGSERNALLGMNNPYLNDQIGAAQDDVIRKYNLATRPAEDQRMAASGSFGNTGLQQMQGESQRNLAGELGRVSSNMRMQDYGLQANLGEGQAGRSLQASGQNAGNQQRTNEFNAGLQSSDLARNTSAYGQQGQFNAGQGQRSREFDANLGFGRDTFNSGVQNTRDTFNAGQAQQNSQFNTGQSNSMGQYNTTSQNQNSQYNTGQANGMGQFNTGQSNSFNLGLRNNDLGFANLDYNINRGNFQDNLAGANFGLNVWDRANNYNNAATGTAGGIYNNPQNQYNQWAGQAGNQGGIGGTSSGSSTMPGGNPWAGAAGGWMLGNQYGNQNQNFGGSNLGFGGGGSVNWGTGGDYMGFGGQ